MDRFSAACNLVTLTEIDEYAREFTVSGLDLTEVIDISDQVRPSMSQHAAAVRAARGTLGPIVGADRLEEMAGLTDRYAALPEFGYVVLKGNGRLRSG